MSNILHLSYFYMDKNAKIYIAGHNWLVWSAIKRSLEEKWYTNLLYKSRWELNLLDQDAVRVFFEKEQPEYVFLAAAKVWGIVANNSYPAAFIYENLQIQNNIIHNSYISKVKKLLFLGSSCIYPKECPQPMREEYLLTWLLEPTNEPYAIAKIAWIKMCQSYNRQYWTNFIACMPTNLYGPNDNFDLQSSHVLPAMIRKFHEAKTNNTESVILRWDWTPLREFLYVDDMADACIFMMNNYNPSQEDNKKWDMFLNIGSWEEVSIKDLAELIKWVVWYEGEIVWDTSKPNGTIRKLLDSEKLQVAWWEHKTKLETGIINIYKWFLENYDILYEFK